MKFEKVDDVTPEEIVGRNSTENFIASLMLRPTDPEGKLPPKFMTVVKRAVGDAFDDARSNGAGFVTLGDLTKKMSGYPDGAEPVERLQDFLKGGLSGDWFDGPTRIDASSRVVCFDLAGVKQDALL
jgi:hypothetical protein